MDISLDPFPFGGGVTLFDGIQECFLTIEDELLLWNRPLTDFAELDWSSPLLFLDIDLLQDNLELLCIRNENSNESITQQYDHNNHSFNQSYFCEHPRLFRRSRKIVPFVTNKNLQVSHCSSML